MRDFDEMQELARQVGPKKVAVVLAHDDVILKAVDHCKKRGIVKPVLIGDAQKLKEIARALEYCLDEDEVIDEADSGKAAVAAVDLINKGGADLIMKGKIQTADLIKAVLDRKTGIRAGRLLSQVNVHYSPVFNRFMFVSDAAINIAPALEQKVDICRNAITVAHALGIAEPKVAALTAHESVSEAMPATVDAHEIKMLNQRQVITEAVIDGPIALDVALDAAAAAKKGISSPIAGQVDILIAPNIEAANILTKAIIYFGQARNAGVVMGAKVPIILLSRSDNADTKINSMALGVVLSA
ncbi:MAG: bifunctional enoyl-CoA hydratase/phosphate acetyltransferase [Peptococcaceae bacterium]|nr:bifunctional enoyl-CoA hydratase/phosphate acetyltransferase [Peptococcaceae bacterium]MDH7525415.1 bifunctional enoyl-CoA hydratase/phosphate acetyltransferase [Peptococcaceae bacterium]